VVHLATLSSSSSEYKDILTHFKNGLGVRSSPKVTKIERIQNPEMFKLYLAKKKSMEGRENEMRLFHGTHVKNIVAINGNNFNRSYSGINGRLHVDAVVY
jgi:exopolysaccharide biosynthesis protein